jgi:hypothetical protein
MVTLAAFLGSNGRHDLVLVREGRQGVGDASKDGSHPRGQARRAGLSAVLFSKFPALVGSAHSGVL